MKCVLTDTPLPEALFDAPDDAVASEELPADSWEIIIVRRTREPNHKRLQETAQLETQILTEQMEVPLGGPDAAAGFAEGSIYAKFYPVLKDMDAYDEVVERIQIGPNVPANLLGKYGSAIRSKLLVAHARALKKQAKAAPAAAPAAE